MNLTAEPGQLPCDVIAFLREAERRIERFQIERHVPGFVPSDFTRVYGMLRALAASDLAGGNLFCEWGSGFGVVACLAAMLDFDVCGIEIDGDLVEEARRLADEFEVPVEFLCGSFIPPGSNVEIDSSSGFAWLTTDESFAPQELEFEPDDFDIIFAYPWPDEEHVIANLFEKHARAGALLLTYHGGDDIRLQRKTVAPTTRRRRRPVS